MQDTKGEQLNNRLIYIGLILVFLALLVMFGPEITRPQYLLNPRDLTHWVGWISIIGLISSMLAKNTKIKLGMENRNLHCILGGLSIAAIIYHVSVRLNPFTGTEIGFFIIRPVHYVSFFTFFLFILLVLSGLARNLYPENRLIVSIGKILHYPVSISFVVTLVFHILKKMAFF